MKQYTSEYFTSLAEIVTLTMEGISDHKLQFTLLLFDEQKQAHAAYETEITPCSGIFRFQYEFDPIHLAVYRNAMGFQAQLEVISGADFHVTAFDLQERSPSYEASDEEEPEPIKYPPLKKVLFIGNSLLLGMFNTYGMCSTSRTKDYAYYVQKAITARYPDCKFFKLHGSAYEQACNDEMFEDWFTNNPNVYSGKPAKESFTADLDLIIIQLTDNVNTEEKTAYFKTHAETFVKKVKEMCPNAAILWVYGWYNKANAHETLKEICPRNGIDRLDISPLHYKENESYSGQISENAAGEPTVIKDTWISHPGDRGMKLIAEKMIGRIFADPGK